MVVKFVLNIIKITESSNRIFLIINVIKNRHLDL